jgi:hypothetical protein
MIQQLVNSVEGGATVVQLCILGAGASVRAGAPAGVGCGLAALAWGLAYVYRGLAPLIRAVVPGAGR